MGEETTFAGLGDTFYFCRREDLGTENEQWHEAKLDSFKLRDAIEIPELTTESPYPDFEFTPGKGFWLPLPGPCRANKDEPWNKQSFTLSAEATRDESFERLIRKIKKHQSGSRFYCRKLLKYVGKKAIRQYLYRLRKNYIKSYTVCPTTYANNGTKPACKRASKASPHRRRRR